VINVGLSSETVSGLSEKGHAGGKFPRPDLFERLDRVLDSAKPDFVFACYGMNCGIYQPLAAQRLEAYQQGINRLREKMQQRGIHLVLVTPPAFDGQVAMERKNFDYPQYDEVLTAYSEWLLTLRDEGQWVIDVHSDFSKALAARRSDDSTFTFQKDAVHPSGEGHQEIAKSIIQWLEREGMSPAGPAKSNADEIETRTERMRILRDAYLSDAGHQRPGVRAGLPIEEALNRVKAIQP
jgi:lysophospholipase L1-like esterase